MRKTPKDNFHKLVKAESSRHVEEFAPRRESANVVVNKQSARIASVLLAALPAISFLGQYVLSLRAGTEQVLLHHLTITAVDWLLVPFNFFAVRIIDWRRGITLYFIMCISVMLSVLTHAFWQYNGLDPGHMITSVGIVLPAGWVHLAFSIVEMALLVAFVFCRKANASGLRVATAFAAIYFLAIGVSGYAVHGRFIISDVIVFVSGLFFVLVYPSLANHTQTPT